MSQKQKNLLTLFLIVALAILFIFFFILPAFKKIEDISQKISETKANLEDIEKRAEVLQNFRKKFPTLKENFSLFENSFVSKELPVDFISFLESTANNYQILSEISLLSSGKDFLSFQVKAIGLPQNVFRFLDRVENSPYLVQIEKITLTKLSKTELKSKELESLSLEGLKLTFSFKVQTK